MSTNQVQKDHRWRGLLEHQLSQSTNCATTSQHRIGSGFQVCWWPSRPLAEFSCCPFQEQCWWDAQIHTNNFIKKAWGSAWAWNLHASNSKCSFLKASKSCQTILMWNRPWCCGWGQWRQNKRWLMGQCLWRSDILRRISMCLQRNVWLVLVGSHLFAKHKAYHHYHGAQEDPRGYSHPAWEAANKWVEWQVNSWYFHGRWL